jgi:hypothetical protein
MNTILTTLTTSVLLSSLAAASPTSLATRHGSTPPSASSTTLDASLSAVAMRDVPRSLRRLVAQHVADSRNVGPEWQNAELNGTVNAFFRPDVEGAAYYEFDVSPQGFVIVSSGRHDKPIPHWSHRGDSIAELLEAKAAGKGVYPARFYKLDSFSYAAEDAQGRLLSELGPRPAKIEGLEALRGMTTEQMKNDPNLENLIVRTEWADWNELKLGFEDAYRLLLEIQREPATVAWDFEDSLSENGVRLTAGAEQPIGLVSELRFAQLTGPGADLAELSRTVDGFGLTRLSLRLVTELPPGAMERLAVTVYSEDGEVDVHRFFVRGDAGQHSGTDASGAGGDPASSNWSGWTTRWAGTHGDQAEYAQFNGLFSDGCMIGCGPVAWAMLLAWVDNQAAAGNPRWVGRWGIYRSNGNPSPAPNAVVPLEHQVLLSTYFMIQIYEELETWCFPGGETGTHPGDMIDVNKYLQVRTGARAKTHYYWDWITGSSSTHLRGKIKAQILDFQTPAIIGTGAGITLHYPLAYGFRWRSRENWWGNKVYHSNFYVNQGWGGGGNGWIESDTWFAGILWHM